MNARMWLLGLTVLLATGNTPSVRAQDSANQEQLKKMYDDALQQLKAAQERKNQLAAEKEALTRQLEALKKDLAATNARIEDLVKGDADHAEKTFFLRSHYMAWQQFAKLNPEAMAKWRVFIESDFLISPRDAAWLLDRAWPYNTTTLPATPRVTTTSGPSTTEPALPVTLPATVPSTIPTSNPSTIPATQTVPSTLPTRTTEPSPSATQPSPGTKPTTSPA